MIAKRHWRNLWITGIVLLTLGTSADAAVKKDSYKTSKGLKVRHLMDNTMDYIHAEVIIFHKDKYSNPAIPALTLLTLFNRDVNKYGSSPLLNQLNKMGGDYTVEQSADYIVVKANFLPDKLAAYARFLKILFSHSSLIITGTDPNSYAYQKRERDAGRWFNRSVKYYWRYFFRGENWKRDIAYQIGYNKLFPGSSIGNTLITADSLKRASLREVRRFYQRAFRLPNSLVVIKGDLKPQLVNAHINREFMNFKNQQPEVPVQHKLKVHDKREIIVFNVKTVETPTLFWFEAVEPLGHENYLPHMVLNHILFGFPAGRVFREARDMRMGDLDIHAEITNHKDVSVLCNYVELRTRDIETFIRLTDRERKKLSIRKVERNEYMNSLSYFHGKMKVDSQHIDNDIGYEILANFYPYKENDFPKLAGTSPQAALATLNRQIEKSKRFSSFLDGVIVIVANYDEVKPYFKGIEPVVFNY